MGGLGRGAVQRRRDGERDERGGNGRAGGDGDGPCEPATPARGLGGRPRPGEAIQHGGLEGRRRIGRGGLRRARGVEQGGNTPSAECSREHSAQATTWARTASISSGSRASST